MVPVVLKDLVVLALSSLDLVDPVVLVLLKAWTWWFCSGGPGVDTYRTKMLYEVFQSRWSRWSISTCWSWWTIPAGPRRNWWSITTRRSWWSWWSWCCWQVWDLVDPVVLVLLRLDRWTWWTCSSRSTTITTTTITTTCGSWWSISTGRTWWSWWSISTNS